MRFVNAFLEWIASFWKRSPPQSTAADTDAPAPRARAYRSVVQYGPVHWVDSQADATPLLSSNAIVMVKGTSGAKWLLMNCPDHCGELRRISVSKAMPPAWTFQTEADGTISLFPSVHLTSGCRVHFVLRHNKAHVI